MLKSKQSFWKFLRNFFVAGYAGAVCHTSLNWLSCIQFQNKHPLSRFTETIIDVDGSGPIPPARVKCEFFPDGRNLTYVEHANPIGKVSSISLFFTTAVIFHEG